MPRFERSILLYNGTAGASTTGTIIPLAVPTLAAASKHLELIQTETQEEFEEACRTSCQDTDAIFVAGGDGTVHTVVQILAGLENPPVLGILPSGTCNDFARTLNIPLLIDEAAEALVGGDIQAIDMALINDRSFLNFAGIGLIADASLNIDPDLKERYGKLSYFMSALQAMRQSAPFSVHLEVDGIHYAEEGEAVLVMNGKSIGTHMLPMEEISPYDGLLDVFIIQAATLAAIREWFSLSRPNVKPEDLEYITHYQGKHIKIWTDEEMQVDTDGEIYLTTPIDIRIQPNQLTMLVPRPVAESIPD
jgi:YegS/Rv2252/BmrU family lipid kinase